MLLNEETFTKILRSNKGILYKVANSYCKNTNDREDLIQEIIIQLWKAWPKYDDTYKVSTWMYRIALNVAISFYRKSNYQRNKYDTFNENLVSTVHKENSDSTENIEQLYHFIAQLSELNKALILLYLEKYSYEEIGTTLGISTTNVATKISRIKKQLKEKFNNN
ncbi:RNA polymerase sigma-70 factor (ECF subfamily) [Aquimarina sp. EL_43]|uniref:RNA polymerase sigma factor n=1 Tax=unclassified Aquimarina TaxID=2627091 RepID=UPI0018C8E520|nr:MULTISPECIES: sigma-70 family RNA polymerase sigma factor [unclassified Aquimarina]MBG6128969.1 RNA polymerase sigma-70 factor (ECF subfamily) [Aquimarina sp. EL_35]MBG6150033.1 RNA polymerase sigma-70 factor (ECF subfamily) [Aquimarina sp. EL_32]MBG6167280.1 RNA polymerase sigma-70 factor (ECF subfamily) [Aquimarina sp. EL_43]